MHQRHCRPASGLRLECLESPMRLLAVGTIAAASVAASCVLVFGPFAEVDLQRTAPDAGEPSGTRASSARFGHEGMTPAGYRPAAAASDSRAVSTDTRSVR